MTHCRYYSLQWIVKLDGRSRVEDDRDVLDQLLAILTTESQFRFCNVAIDGLQFGVQGLGRDAVAVAEVLALNELLKSLFRLLAALCTQQDEDLLYVRTFEQ